MSGQISGYVTVADFVEMVRKKFDSQKSPVEVQDEKITELTSISNQPPHTKHQRQSSPNDNYGVDITV